MCDLLDFDSDFDDDAKITFFFVAKLRKQKQTKCKKKL